MVKSPIDSLKPNIIKSNSAPSMISFVNNCEGAKTETTLEMVAFNSS